MIEVSGSALQQETELDLDFIRCQFPAFKEPKLEDWGFFENAGGTYACGQVINCLQR